jgi:hypothetical protein
VCVCVPVCDVRAYVRAPVRVWCVRARARVWCVWYVYVCERASMCVVCVCCVCRV